MATYPAARYALVLAKSIRGKAERVPAGVRRAGSPRSAAGKAGRLDCHRARVGKIADHRWLMLVATARAR